MSIDLTEFEKLKTKVETCRRKADKAQGALDQTMKVLKDNHDCNNIEEAKELLAKLKKEADKMEARFKKSEDAFMEKWRDKLDV